MKTLKETLLALAMAGGIVLLFYFDDANYSADSLCTTDSECTEVCESQGGTACHDTRI